jgi:hypothetical protein
MKRGRSGKRIRWNAKSIAGCGAAMLVILAVYQVPNFFWIWAWGPNTGYRAAGLSSGHYERMFPAILRGMPFIGFALVRRGDRLLIDYDLTIDEGKAQFAVWKWPIVANRPRDIGPPMIERSGGGRIDYLPEEPGLYRISMYSFEMQGSVRVDWRTVDAADSVLAIKEP